MFSLKSCLQSLRGAVICITALLAGSAAASAQSAEVIQNRWSPTQYINVQGGVPQAGAVAPGTPEAGWAVERSGDPTAFRLRHIATGMYLIADGAGLRMGQAGEAEQAGRWMLERVAGNPDARIRNISTGGYLHTKDGPLVIGDASPEWQQSFWKFIPAGAAAQPVLPPVPPVDACRASFGKWLWINGKYVCAKGCPIGFHQAGNTCVKSCPFGFHWNGQFCVKTCPPGFHPVGNICVKNAFCPIGFHLSLGHCCPNGKNWNPVINKCV